MVKNPDSEFNLSEEEWKKRLSDEEYKILRQKGTEKPFSGKYNQNKNSGTYLCAACGCELFESDTKYDSGSGWPSFYKAKNEQSVALEKDDKFGMQRTEVLCKRCHSHLGHVFDDGPQPTGQRFCINSMSLAFKPKQDS